MYEVLHRRPSVGGRPKKMAQGATPMVVSSKVLNNGNSQKCVAAWQP